MMKIHCIICGTGNLDSVCSVIGTDNITYTVIKCECCGVASIDPLPDFDKIAGEYKSEYYKKDALTLKSVLEDDIPLLRLQRKSRIEPLKPSGRLLDIGCGGGGFLKSLDGARWERHGVDISERAVAPALRDKDIKIKTGGLTKETYPEGYFDVITLWHVLEHLLDPAAQLDIIRKILKKGGLLVIAVPNIESLEAKLCGKYWYHLDIPRHVYHYSPRGIEAILKQQGFEVVKVNGFIPKNIYGITISLINRIGFEFNLFKDLYMRNKKLDSFKAVFQAALMAVLSPVVITSALAVFLAELATGRSGTFEVFAVKQD